MHDSTQLRNVIRATTLQCMIMMITIDDDMHVVYKIV